MIQFTRYLAALSALALGTELRDMRQKLPAVTRALSWDAPPAWAMGIGHSPPLPRLVRHPLQGQGRNQNAHTPAKVERRRQSKQRARRRGW